MRALEAKKILPKDEYEIFEAVLTNQISRMSQQRLSQKVTLARRLREKYKDQARRSVADLKFRRTNHVDTDIDDRRVQLFKEIIAALEDAMSTAHSTRSRTNSDISKKDRKHLHEPRHR